MLGFRDASLNQRFRTRNSDTCKQILGDMGGIRTRNVSIKILPFVPDKFTANYNFLNLIVCASFVVTDSSYLNDYTPEGSGKDSAYMHNFRFAGVEG